MESDAEGFQSLPVEVKLRIFSHFPLPFLTTSVARVCKNWWELSQDRWLWKDEDVVIFYNRVTSSEQYGTIVSRCSMLRKLTIRRSNNHGGDASYQVPEISSLTLRELRMKDAPTSEHFWMNLDVKFPCLQTLELEYQSPPDSLDFLYKICALSRLKCLKLRINGISCQNSENCHIKPIIEKFTGLETLHLRWKICEDCFDDMIHHLETSLKELSLDKGHITNEEISLLSECNELTTLDLNLCQHVCGSFFQHLNTLDLEDLELRYRWCMLDDGDFEEISSNDLSSFFRSPHRRGLRKLHLGGFEGLTDRILVTIGRSCTDLTELGIEDSIDVRDEGVVRCLKYLPVLSHLYLSYCCISRNILARIPPTVVVKWEPEPNEIPSMFSY